MSRRRRRMNDLTKAREAALEGDLRTAYHHLYRGLDTLFLTAKWDEVSAELKEICTTTYPSAFGIGALRFSSDASKYIPDWDILLKQIKDIVAEEQGGIVSETNNKISRLRGLV
jgi:hypothetical protein